MSDQCCYDTHDKTDECNRAASPTEQVTEEPDYAALANVVDVPPGLHKSTRNLVIRFAGALAQKLYAAQEKYGYSDGWKSDDWMDECRAKTRHHLEKGDPRDVAAYCAFLWHHGESTVSSAPTTQAYLKAYNAARVIASYPHISDVHNRDQVAELLVAAHEVANAFCEHLRPPRTVSEQQIEAVCFGLNEREAQIFRNAVKWVQEDLHD
jgi:hypothetical protein